MSKTKRLTRDALLGAFLFVIMKSLSNILYVEAITISIVTIALVFDLSDSLLSSLTFSFLILMITGVSTWNLMYALIYSLYTLLTYLLKKPLLKHQFLLIPYCFFLAFLTGQLLDLPFILINKNVGLFYIITGLKTSLIQGIIVSIEAILIFEPMHKTLSKIKERY